MSYNLIVIGSGPGGYVAAIRASQLGMKVAIVEKESLGGICLNWGCIPTKALLKSAQVFDYVNHSENYGIKISKSSVDFDSIISRSRGVADGMSKGVNFLMKKNKIDILNGFGKIISKNEVEVTTEENKKEIHKSDNIIIATGGRSRELPNLKIDNKKVIELASVMKALHQENLNDPQIGKQMAKLLQGRLNVTSEIAEKGWEVIYENFTLNCQLKISENF